MPDPIALTPAQAFEQERFSRAIDATTDPVVLQALCKQLLQAWMVQRLQRPGWPARARLRGIGVGKGNPWRYPTPPHGFGSPWGRLLAGATLPIFR